ncbi:MAG: hypothetical protein OEY89_12325 [Gammaproteobacteria bacterium]|nr:hypothetical protein [Gammaproteobacteria bacterium]
MKADMTLFEDYQIRRVYDEESEIWWFSVIDIVQVLTQQADYQAARNYWKVLKNRLTKEGSEAVTNCNRLKMIATDGKQRMMGHDCMDAGVRAMQGAIAEETRNKLTDYWTDHNIKQGDEFAILTNIIHQEWTELSVKDHKHLKGLKSQNLRDHMSEAELIFTALAELSTRQIAETEDATGMDENKIAAKTGGGVAKKARKDLEAKTGRKVVTADNYLPSPNKKNSPTVKTSKTGNKKSSGKPK